MEGRHSGPRFICAIDVEIELGDVALPCAKHRSSTRGASSKARGVVGWIEPRQCHLVAAGKRLVFVLWTFQRLLL